MQEEQRMIRRALLSVTDKTGLVEFARLLVEFGVDLVSTGGTARALREASIPVREISELTEFPEMLDGRVKTLHPRVHGGLLYIRGNAEHEAAVRTHGIEPIDMVVVNLYAFEKTAQTPGVRFGQLIENIDIGGPSMVRSAAKNFRDVAIVTNVADYASLSEELRQNAGSLSLNTRWRLARQAFATTAAYDAAIASTLEMIPSAGDAESTITSDVQTLPQTLRVNMPLAMPLRYGENPHQRAALYSNGTKTGIAGAEQLQGKDLSFNNLVDLDACWALAQEFPEPTVAIIKHTNPCGVATGATVRDAYGKALAADPVSAFGGVIGINHTVDGEAAAEIAKLFTEAIAAPDYTPEALAVFAAKKNLRVLRVTPAADGMTIKHISGGILVQDADCARIGAEDMKVVTQRKPTQKEIAAMLFAWRICKHVKSNAIVYARDGQTLGVGAGQMSRVDAARFGALKAVLALEGCVVASDAFFPFPDGLEVVVQAGATAIIQPGGSVRDAEVIAAADRLGVAMAFTGIRHFRH